MGGKSKSSSSSSTEYDAFSPQLSNSDNADIRNSDTKISVGSKSSVNLMLSDHGAMKDALDFTQSAALAVVDQSSQARQDSLSFAAGGMQEALSQSAAAREDALMFGGEAFTEAMEATAAAQERAAAAQAAANKQTAAAYQDAMGKLSQGNSQAFSFAGGAQNSAFEFVGGAFDRVLDEVRVTSESAAQTVASSAAHVNNLALESLNRVESANRTDSSKFMKTALLAGVALGGLAIWKR